MADKSIDQLIAADQILPTDLFVLQQSNMAKKLPGQVLLNWLTAAADGHGGIRSIEKLSTNVLVDTYRITLADTTTFDFVVTNGRSVNTIVKVGTANLVDTYQINYNDGTTGTFNVTNGAKGDKGDNTYIWIKYASQRPTASSHSFGDIADDWIGIYYGASATAPTDWQQYEWFQIKGEKGDPGAPATLVSSAIDYQASDSGTIIPSGTWLSSVPVVAQGKYLWARTTNTFNTGSPVVAYSVSRMGIDGTGSVSSVAGISPDTNGNVPLTAEDVNALPITGGTMEGSINMNGQKLSGLNAPTADDEAATKGYALAKDRVTNSFSVTEAGYVADARALKTLKDLSDAKLSVDLLWVNASINSEFSAQTIPIDVSEYEYIMIAFPWTDTAMIFRKGIDTTNHYRFSLTSTANNACVIEMYRRSFAATQNGLEVSDCMYSMYTTNSAKFTDVTTKNKILKPHRIYGLRGFEL